MSDAMSRRIVRLCGLSSHEHLCVMGLRGSARSGSLGEKIGLTLSCDGQQLGELGGSTELHQQRVGLEGSIGTIVLFDGFFQQAQGGILLFAVGEQGSYGIERLDVGSG